MNRNCWLLLSAFLLVIAAGIFAPGLTVDADQKKVISASAEYPSITKTSVQDFTVKTTTDVNYLMLYAEDGKTLVKTWQASGNSTVSGDVRTWKVSQPINTPGDRKLVIKGGTTNNTPVTNAVTASFKVESTGVISASAKYATIRQGGEQVFTIKTTSDAKYLVEYAEDGFKVKTWTANSSNSTVSGNVRTWTVKQNINTAGKRTLSFKAGTTLTPTSAQRSVTFTVEEVARVDSASVKYATIGKGGTQTFTVKTNSVVQYLMLYAEGGNLVKTWAASGNSTVSGSVRTWNVSLAINTVGNRKLVFKGGTINNTPITNAITVSFKVENIQIQSVTVKCSKIAKGANQTFVVKTSADAKYLVEYAEDGFKVKIWAATDENSSVSEGVRTWTLTQPINTDGKRMLSFKAGSTSTPTSAAATVSFTVLSVDFAITTQPKDVTATIGGNATFTALASGQEPLKYHWQRRDAGMPDWVDVTSPSASGRKLTVKNVAIENYGDNYRCVVTDAKGQTLYSNSVFLGIDLSDLSIPVDETYFPDDAFRAFVVGNIDTDKNGTLSPAEIEGVTRVDVDKMNISSLKGIEFFAMLKVLCCSQNTLTTLDVSNNTALMRLSCGWNKLTTLDVRKNILLNELWCNSNQLTTLDVSKNTSLKSLRCSFNQLATLDVSKNTALEELDCSYNILKTLDVSRNTKLVTLECYKNTLYTLTLGKNTALTKLDCKNNQLSTVDASGNTALEELYCNNNRLNVLKVKSNMLWKLDCNNNQLNTLDLSNSTALRVLVCYQNQFGSLDLSHNLALEELSCSNDCLDTLDVSKNTALVELHCNNNFITSLKTGNNPALKVINCANNRLNVLDVSDLSALEELYCWNNRITTLDVSHNPLLKKFNCDDGVVVTGWH